MHPFLNLIHNAGKREGKMRGGSKKARGRGEGEEEGEKEEGEWRRRRRRERERLERKLIQLSPG